MNCTAPERNKNQEKARKELPMLRYSHAALRAATNMGRCESVMIVLTVLTGGSVYRDMSGLW